MCDVHADVSRSISIKVFAKVLAILSKKEVGILMVVLTIKHRHIICMGLILSESIVNNHAWLLIIDIIIFSNGYINFVN